MSLGQLKRTLQREFTRNPAKSATLLALIPVAGYFIVPLVWKQLPAAKGAKTSQATFVASAGSEPVAAVAGPLTGPQAGPRWQDIAEWIGEDPRMKPSTFVSLRDPFRPLSKPEEVKPIEEPQEAEPAPSAASLRPEDCGLILTATIVGPAKRLATINGRLYAENAIVRFENAGAITAGGSSPDNAFVLKTVAKTHVVLERNGELFRLRINGNGDVEK